ncbi:MAG: PAS domain-containing sensor histidine kinase [Chloroflexota bacterium]
MVEPNDNSHNDKLLESEERYRLLSELMSDYAFSGFFRAHDKVEIDWFTGSAFRRLTGYDIGHVFNLPDVPIMLKEYLKQVNEDVHKVQGGQSTSKEYCITTREGDIRWLRVDHYPRWNERKDQVIGFYGIAHDITESKLVQQQERQIAAEREKAKVLNQFIDNISHDFRTPLSVLKTSIYLLRQSGQTTDHDRLGVMEHQINNLTRLFDNLILVSRLNNIDKWSFKSVNIKHILTTLCVHVEQQAKEKAIQVSCKMNDDGLLVYGDLDHIYMALQQILQNAVQFTPSGGRVSLRAYKATQAVVIEVEDTGIGIKADDLPHIFDLFFRVNTARTSDGKGGMGLSIVRQIVEAHNGSIEVKSVIEQGSLFQVRFPLFNG